MNKKIAAINRRLTEVANVFGEESIEYGKQMALVEGFLDSVLKGANLYRKDVETKRMKVLKDNINQFAHDFGDDLDEALDLILKGQKNLGSVLKQAKRYSKGEMKIEKRTDIKKNLDAIKEKAHSRSMEKKISTDFYVMLDILLESDVKDDIYDNWLIMCKMRRTDTKEEMYNELVKDITYALAGIQRKSIDRHENTSKGGRLSTDALPY